MGTTLVFSYHDLFVCSRIQEKIPKMRKKASENAQDAGKMTSFENCKEVSGPTSES